MKKMSAIIALFIILTVPTGLLAKSPNPYVPVNKGEMTVNGRIVEICDTGCIQFFTESKSNLGINDTELIRLAKDGKTKVEDCGKDCILETAGLLNGRSVYWRNVESGEAVVYVESEGKWLPWFLLRCANPVRPVPPLEAVSKKKPVLTRPCGYTHEKSIVSSTFSTITGATFVDQLYGFGHGFNDYGLSPIFGGISTSTTFNGVQIYTPAHCISEQDYEKLYNREEVQ